MEEIWITQLGLDVLLTMETYQFMTATQLTRAGKFTSVPTVRRTMNAYVNRREPLLHVKDFGTLPDKGRLHKIYALTRNGAEVLAEHRQCPIDRVMHLTGKIQFNSDYFHRLTFVDVHIALREWAQERQANIEFFTSYFETEGANRGPKSALKLSKKNKIDLPNFGYIVPDGLFSFTLAGKRRLCALELHRGKDTKTILDQLAGHIEALYSKAIQNKFRHESANFVLSVYENERIMQAVKKRIRMLPDFRAVMRAFHFSTVDKVLTDIVEAWTLADDSPVSIFR